jgi:adenosylmethionine-8-amino-7-oxononanoate aminotransferase
MFAVEHSGVVPDMMTLSKGLSSGYFPIGAAVKREIADVFTGDAERMFRHGHTYSGHPVGCAIALENIRLIEEERLAERAAAAGEALLRGLAGLSHHAARGGCAARAC